MSTTEPYRAATVQVPAVPGAYVPPVDLYSEAVDVRQAISPEQVEMLEQNGLEPGMPPWAVVVLTILTLGLFGTIYLHLKHNRLPKVKADDPSNGKAIGFMFIPLFGIYWYFFAWLRLVDRINLQFRLRGHEAPISRGQVKGCLGTCLAGGWLIIPLLVGIPWALVLAAKIQRASNALANG